MAAQNPLPTRQAGEAYGAEAEGAPSRKAIHISGMATHAIEANDARWMAWALRKIEGWQRAAPYQMEKEMYEKSRAKLVEALESELL